MISEWSCVTNLVASHHTTDAHHPWTTTPIIHCTTTHTVPSTIAPITQLSSITNQPWLSCHTCTSFTHPHISSTLPYARCKVLFLPRLTFMSVIHPAICYLCVWPWTARPWNSEPVLVTSTPAWYCLRLCSASDIPVSCPLTIACLILPLSNKSYCKWIHSPQTSHYIMWHWSLSNGWWKISFGIIKVLKYM